MAYVVADRILETSVSVGAGAFALAAAVTGYRRFGARLAVGDTCHYLIQGVDIVGRPTGEYEYGLGTYSAANTLTRTTLYGSSTGAAVVFTAGTKFVALAPLAPDAAGATTDWRTSLNINNVDNTSDAAKPVSIVQASAIAGSLFNKLDNSSMAIMTYPAAATTVGFVSDRWKLISNIITWAATSQTVQDGPPRFPTCLRTTLTTAAAPPAGSYFSTMQGVEGNNWRDMGYGYVNGVPAVLTLWIKASFAGDAGFVSLRNSANTRSICFPVTANVAQTWERKTFFIPPCPDGVWEINDGAGVYFNFSPIAGSSLLTPTEGAWVTGNFLGTTGKTAFSSRAVNSHVSFTKPQLLQGTTDVGDLSSSVIDEYVRCQRYCVAFTVRVYRSSDNGSYAGSLAQFLLPSAMRKVPDVLRKFLISGYSWGTIMEITDNRSGGIWYEGSGPPIGQSTLWGITLGADF